MKPLNIKKIGDPYVLRVDDCYYLYATSNFDGFYCWKSKDLQNWQEPVICYEKSDASFGDSCFWAPEVYQFEDKFYMYYTAQWKIYKHEELRIGVAVSDSPLGPFKEVYDQQPMFDLGYGVLDAHVLKDENKDYLYFSRAGANHLVDGALESDIRVLELAPDHVSVIGEAKLIARPEQSWERNPADNQYWNEGQFILKHEGRYHMMYSANFYGSADYGIGGAVADSPWGPFVKYPHNPILSTTETVSGPGHNSIVSDSEGQLYCVFHAHTDYEKKGGDRQVYILPMAFVDSKIKVTVAAEELKA